MSELKVGRIEFAPLKVGTQRILRTTDMPLATAFNQAVEAIRELQGAVAELQREVEHLKAHNTGRSPDGAAGE